MDHRISARLLVVLGTLGLAAGPPPARAANVDLTAGLLSFVDPAMVANVLSIGVVGATYTIADPAEAALALSPNAQGAGCVPLTANTVTCPAATIASISVRSGLGNDTIDLTGAAHPAIVIAGDGDDLFLGGPAADTFVWNPGDDDDVIDGGPGDDVLIGGRGDDTVSGGPGDDRINGAAGNDNLAGGDGADRLDGGSADDACIDTDQSGPFARCELP